MQAPRQGLVSGALSTDFKYGCMDFLLSNFAIKLMVMDAENELVDIRNNGNIGCSWAVLADLL